MHEIFAHHCRYEDINKEVKIEPGMLAPEYKIYLAMAR